MARSRRTSGRGGRPSYVVRRIESWAEYLDAVGDSPVANWAFRGQADAAWPLNSSLSRYLEAFRLATQAWADQERRNLRIFKRQAHLFLDRPPAATDDFEWLALMQHHGAPTRLIDFTWSPYVAAFFALERATTDAAVWAINPQGTKYNTQQRTRDDRVIDPEHVDPRHAGNLERYFLSGEIPFVWIGEPQIMNRRLLAQAGTFAVPGTLKEPVEAIMAGYDEPAETLLKLVLSTTAMRDRAMRELYRMKITYASLFPDLDGLARSLAYELEFHWSYDPRRRNR